MIKKITLALCLFASSVCHAAFISGNHTLSNGKSVALQGLEWMPLTYTSNMSRLDIEDGFTDHFGNLWAVGDWQYATRAQTETLINSLWGGVYDGWSNDNYIGASWFLNHFGGLAFDTGSGPGRVAGTLSAAPYTNLDRSDFFFGQDGECNPARSCLGSISTFDNHDAVLNNFNMSTGQYDTYTANSGAAGLIEDKFGSDVGRTGFNGVLFKFIGDTTVGSLLVRQANTTTPVPAPSVLTLLGLALFTIAVRRK